MCSKKGKKPEKIEILIVEDSPTQAMKLQFMLEENNYQVSVAQNGFEALTRLEEHVPDAIITDIIMPEMDGFQLCEKIKSDDNIKHIPIIVLTSLSEPEDIVRGLTSGADNFVTKPWNDKSVLSRIQYVLANSEMRRESVLDKGMEIFFEGKKHVITSNPTQILDLLFSTYEINLQKSKELYKINTELLKTQEELNESHDKIKKSEMQFRTLFDNAVSAIITIDEKGAIESVNKAFTHLFGYAPDEVLGKNVKMLMPEPYVSEHDGYLKNYFTTGEKKIIGIDIEVKARKKNGEVFYCVLGVSELNVNGKWNAVGIISDITERKEREQFLEKQKTEIEILHQVTELASESESIDDSLKKCLDAICKSLDWPVGHVYVPSVTKKNILDPTGIWHLSDEKSFENLKNVTEKTSFKKGKGLPGRIWESEKPAWVFNVHLDDNFPRNKLVKDLGVKGAFGFPIFIQKDLVAVCEFFTTLEMDPDYQILKTMKSVGEQIGRVFERKKAAAELLESEERISLATKAANVGLWDINVKTGEVYFNELWMNMLGYKHLELPHSLETWLNLLHPDDKDRSLSWFEDYLKEVIDDREKIYEQEFRLRKKNGTYIWILARGRVSIWKHGVPVRLLGTHVDLTDRIKAEIELKKAKEAADIANEAKSIFLANMSHEIRTPMNAVLGFSEILGGMIEDPKQKEYLNLIKSSGKSLLGLINDILDLSKVEAGKLELEYTAVDVYYVFNEMKQIFSQKIQEKGIDFIVEIDQNLPKALVLDEVRLRQVLLNLIGNAIKFTSKGYVKVSAANQYPEEDHSSLDLIFSIEDTGIGVPENQRDKIFGAFDQQEGQSTGEFGGTGLGLAITKRLVEMMDGIITVEGEVGKGSVFSVTLKNIAVASVADSEYEDSIDVDSFKFEMATILVVDDIEVNRKVVSGYLEPYGLNLIEAENGKEAIESMKNKTPDLVLMDMKMPVMNGYEATKILKKDPYLKEIPIIALTASTLKESEAEISAICDGYLRKPVTKSDLINELAKFLEHTKEDLKIESEIGHSSKPQDVISETEYDDHEIVNSEELLNLLINNKDKWEKIKDTLTINEVEDFAKEMIEIGENHKYGKLCTWGKEIEKYASLFEIDKLGNALSDFTVIINELESKNNK